MLFFSRSQKKENLVININTESNNDEKEKLYDDSFESIKHNELDHDNKKTKASQVDYVSIAIAQKVGDLKTYDVDEQNQSILSKTNLLNESEKTQPHLLIY